MDKETPSGKRKFQVPTAYTILLALIVVAAALTWIVPAGEFDREMNPSLGQETPIPGTYHEVESSPQRLLISMIMAPVKGMYDPDTGEIRALDVALFVLMIGGFLNVVSKT